MIDPKLIAEIQDDSILRSIIFPDDPTLWNDFYFYDFFDTPTDYQEILDWIDNGGNLIRFGYRGCAKTSILRKRLCKRIATKRNKFIRWTSYDVNKAEDNITSISNMLIGSSDSIFVHDYGRLYYNDRVMDALFKQKEQKRTSGFTSTNGVVVKANSVKKSTRGLNIYLGDQSLRPDLDVLDDIDDDENTQNPRIITKTYNKIKGAIFGGSLGQKIVLGNTINEDGVLPRLAEELKDNPKRRVVYTRFMKEDGTLHRPDRFVKTRAEADKINKNRIENYVQSLEDIREEQGRDWYGANYMLIPMRNDVPIIEEQWIRYREYHKIPYGDKTYISIDSGESEKDKSDPIGITIGTRIRESGKWNMRHSEELTGRQKDLTRIDERLSRLYDQYDKPEFIIENKAGGMTLRKYLLTKHPNWIIHLYDPGRKSKIGRLRECQPYLEGGAVEFSPDIDQKFITQLIKFPNVEHDDRVDSFTAIILKFKYHLDKIEKENTKSIESKPKNDIPGEERTKSKAQELIDKYSPKKSFFTKDF